MFLDGFAFSMYRSFGPDPQLIGPLGKINLIVGQNNSGKSNILTFLKDHLQSAVRDATVSLNQQQHHSRQMNLTGFDIHRGVAGPSVVGVALDVTRDDHTNTIFSLYDRLLATSFPYHIQPQQLKLALEKVTRSQALLRGTSAAWFLYRDQGGFSPKQLEDLFNEKPITDPEWQSLWSAILALRGHQPSSLPQVKECIPIVLAEISPVGQAIPQRWLIPALRRIGETDSSDDATDLSGMGIIAKLHKLQSPSLNDPNQFRHNKEQFEKINQFLRIVLGKQSARLEIDYSSSAISVEVEGNILPLSNHGTGVHQVIILAAAATIIENQIICMEEPELHLHPILQRKLLRYLKDQTNNQYFITTHSAHLLDTPGIRIFHVRHHGGESRVEQASTSTSRANICFDLGYRASDLVQANSIIWVEGPTERLYLAHWIKAVDPNLIEGLHYSIMFYGGRLLSHLTAQDLDDFEVEEFISLRRLNRYISIVMDSDCTSAADSIHGTKKRIEEEFNKGEGFAWVTQGREIENYIPAALLEECVKNTHRAAVSLTDTDQYAHPYLYTTADGTCMNDVKNIDKVKLARAVIGKTADLDVLDLKEKIESLVCFIRKANDDEVA